MKKKLRKFKQLTLINRFGAGRPPFNDKGIRHTSRPILKRPSSLHLTIKVRKNKAEIKNKPVLSLLKRAILNSRKKGLKVIHFSLEYDHIHLLIEAENNFILGNGMQSFGVTIAKGINRIKKLKGTVYKHRYHFRRITSSRELKNVMKYIFYNGLKHKSTKSIMNPYHSIEAEIKHLLFTDKKIILSKELMAILDRGKIYYRGLEYV